MRPFHPTMMLGSPSLLRAAAKLALAIALLPGCGGAQSAPPYDKTLHQAHVAPTSSAVAGDEAQKPDAEGSFMRVGPLQPVTGAEPTTPPPAEPPPPPVEKKTPTKATTQPVTTATARAAEGADPAADAPSDRKPGVEGAVVEPKGGISEADVRAAITEKRAGFRACYELGLRAAPDFSGSVALRVAISPAGNVASADVLQSTTKSLGVDACVRDEVRKLVFKSTGSGAVVVFPIEFGR